MALVMLAGCASIVGHDTQTVGLKSVPPGAAVTIVDEKGETIFEGKTPTTVTLKKSTGSYWGGKNYVVKLSLPGYKDQDIALKTSPNGWYLAGNLVFGGLIGWFIVDPFNGGMYTLSPDQVQASMHSQVADNFKYKSGDLTIVMIQDIPHNLRSKMTRVGQLAAS
jgi:uncharacterized protein YceK